jgi:acyl-homoserine-lactone acylase
MPRRPVPFGRRPSAALSRRAMLRGAAAGGAMAALASRRARRESAAQGATPATGQGAGAEILWDVWGVPHIFADDVASLFHAFGWAQLHSHGDLILRFYGQARGRAAEYWGEDYLESDRLLQTMGFPERAADWYAAQRPDFQRWLDAFAAGMNAYAAAHGDRLADEVKVVLPVSALDVLAHGQRFWFAFLASGGDRAGLVPPDLLGYPAGSNGWAIAPSRTADGHALLLANPHLPWFDFYLFYEAQLVVPEIYDVYGATLVGAPILAIAFNDALGWTHTVNTIDGWDAYALTPDGDGYRFGDETLPFAVETKTLKVKQPDGSLRDEPLTVRRSVHGPVIAGRDGKPIALRVVGVDQALVTGCLEQWWEMGRARNLEEFEAALRRMQLAMFNVLYADRDGHILAFYAGRVPKRSRGDWDFWAGVVPGDDPDLVWTETLPYETLPRLVDPASGWVHNANEPPWTTTLPMPFHPDEFPPYLAPPFGDDGPGFRAQRSMRMLVDAPRFKLDHLVDDANATAVEMAGHLLDDLLVAARAHGGDLARRAADVLAAWDRRTDADSRGAALFILWGEAARSQAQADGRSLLAVPWMEDAPLATPAGLADPAAAVAALEAAARQLDAAGGALDVPWGDIARLRYGAVDLPAVGGPGDPFGIFRTVNLIPERDGRYRSIAGDSFIAAVEFANPVRARVLLTYGNATQPGSPHVGDQLALFARKEMRPAWRTRAEIEANLEAREWISANAAT